MEHILQHEDGKVRVETEANDAEQSRVVVDLDSSRFMLYDRCETSYPVELILQILDVKGPAGLVDEILREESSGYLHRTLDSALLGYVEATAGD